MTNPVPILTIDGPSGTGKGTLCEMLARHLKWNMLDSGAIYRVLAFAVQENQVDVTDVPSIVDLAQNLNLRFVFNKDNKPRVLLNNQDITQRIRSEQCGQTASKVAAIPEVRLALLDRQRAFAESPGLVTDGRDMGTVVFPNALLKLYLDASVQERAKRRYLQLQEAENNASLAQVVNELKQRDQRDASREHSPLKIAEDAVYIDTTSLTIVQVCDFVLELLDTRIESVKTDASSCK